MDDVVTILPRRIFRRRVKALPEPIFHHLAHKRAIVGRSAAELIGRCHAPTERRTTDGHDEQSILVVNQLARAEEIDVKSVRCAACAHVDA